MTMRHRNGIIIKKSRFYQLTLTLSCLNSEGLFAEKVEEDLQCLSQCDVRVARGNASHSNMKGASAGKGAS